MKTSYLLTLSSFIFLGLVGCSGSSSTGDGLGFDNSQSTSTKKEDYAYEFIKCKKYNFETNQCIEVDCTTGKQSFTSLQALCDGLESNVGNGGKMWEWSSCMKDSRETMFKQMCSGTFTERDYVWGSGESWTGSNLNCKVTKDEARVFNEKSELCAALRTGTTFTNCNESARKTYFAKLGCEGTF